MAKRTKYIVNCPSDHIARFSEYWHAMEFAQGISRRFYGHLIEVAARDGLVGQYQDGQSTPEFEAHHKSAYAA